MPTCFFCGKETQLNIGGTPVCVACDDLRESKKAAKTEKWGTGDPILEALQRDLAAAKKRHAEARAIKSRSVSGLVAARTFCPQMRLELPVRCWILYPHTPHLCQSARKYLKYYTRLNSLRHIVVASSDGNRRIWLR